MSSQRGVQCAGGSVGPPGVWERAAEATREKRFRAYDEERTKDEMARPADKESDELLLSVYRAQSAGWTRWGALASLQVAREDAIMRDTHRQRSSFERGAGFWHDGHTVWVDEGHERPSLEDMSGRDGCARAGGGGSCWSKEGRPDALRRGCPEQAKRGAKRGHGGQLGRAVCRSKDVGTVPRRAMVSWKVGTSARSAGAAEHCPKFMILDWRVDFGCKRQHLNARS